LKLPARSPACVFHVIEGATQANIAAEVFDLDEADTCCAPGYCEVSLLNRSVDAPSFVFMADEGPLHRKLGVEQLS